MVQCRLWAASKQTVTVIQTWQYQCTYQRIQFVIVNITVQLTDPSQVKETCILSSRFDLGLGITVKLGICAIFAESGSTGCLLFESDECHLGTIWQFFYARQHLWPTPAEKRRLRPISAYNVSTVRASEKSLVIANRKSTTRFPTSYRRSPYVVPNSPKGWLKKRICRLKTNSLIFPQ